jgi:HSP20 family protein
MTLVKRNDIWDELDTFPRSLKLWEEPFARLFSDPGLRPWTPAVDIVETEDELTFRADLPGMKQEDIDVQIENGTLTLKGSRKFEQEEKEKGYHRIERSYGSFTRAFSLPDTVDTEKAKASYKDGVLQIVFARREAAKPRSVKVSVG